MLTNLDILMSRLRDAEYVYLLLEPLPLFGLFFGLIFFAIGLHMAEERCRMTALVVITASCASTIPYAKYRDQAMPRVLQTAEITRVPGIKKQTELRDETRWVYYLVGGFGLAALVGGGKLGTWSHTVMLMGGVIAVIFSIWLHMKEAEVYHPNIKKSILRRR
ncbi:MAG: hypothetical protein ACOYMN_21615 [Roseimicrobium sp.]